MNILKKAIICIICSLIIQCSILFYCDRILFKESTDFTIENVEPIVENDTNKISIPTNAENIKSSFSGNYITYFQNDQLNIINTATGETKEILVDAKLLSIEWVPKNNTLFFVENKDGRLKVKTYYANNGNKQEVCDLCSYKENMDIQSFISLSTEYISIATNKNTVVYRIDIEKSKKEIYNSKFAISNVSVSQNKDLFYYQSLHNKTFYKYTNGKSKQINIENSNQLTILKAIGNTLYMAYCSENSKISKITYGESEIPISDWKSTTLTDEIDKKDIYISSSNQIYINNNLKGIVTNVTTGDTIQYDGKFILMNDKIICTSKDNCINFTNLNI